MFLLLDSQLASGKKQTKKKILIFSQHLSTEMRME